MDDDRDYAIPARTLRTSTRAPLLHPVSALEEMTAGEREGLEIEIYVQECADAIEDVEGAQIECVNWVRIEIVFII
jgi:hypothetical protein